MPSRRSLIQKGLLLTAGLMTHGLISAFAKEKADWKSKLVKPTDQMPKMMDYKAKSTTPGQKCSDCVQYTKVNDQYGTCLIFQNGNVPAEGWCKVYAKKG